MNHVAGGYVRNNALSAVSWMGGSMMSITDRCCALGLHFAQPVILQLN